MCRKLIALLIVLGFASSVFAAAITFDDGNGTSLWSDPANWDDGAGNPGLPGITDLAIVGGSAATPPVPVTCDVDMDACPDVSYLGSTGVGNVINIDNGYTLDANTMHYVAFSAGSSSTVNIGDGALKSTSGLQTISIGDSGCATVNLTHDNSLVRCRNIWTTKVATGWTEINVLKGLVECIEADSGYGSWIGLNNTYGPWRVDIHDGTFVIDVGDAKGALWDTQIPTWIAGGWFIGYDNAGWVNYRFTKNYTGASDGGVYIMTAGIPEPATIMLLGLGGLALIRKRR